MVKMLKREGLPEHTSIRIAEHIFPKMELSPWRLRSLMSEVNPVRGKKGKLVGKQDR
ncbi:MAG: hypothetical protein QXO76_12435 [Thermoproteota archaeon]